MMQTMNPSYYLKAVSEFERDSDEDILVNVYIMNSQRGIISKKVSAVLAMSTHNLINKTFWETFKIKSTYSSEIENPGISDFTKMLKL